MKITLILFFLLPVITYAQSVGVKDIPAANGNTTIEIKKGTKLEKEFEIISDDADIEGDPAPLTKEARNNWKAACSQWKQEIKDLNKDNYVLSASCGSAECSTVGMETKCSSVGKYKLKVRVK
jgi:hypothetical protein